MSYRICRLIALLLLGAMFEPGMNMSAPANAQARFRWNIKESKKTGQAAILKVMELQAKVAMMITQGSDNIALMNKLLDESYDRQADAIGMMERIKQAEDFPDPIKVRLIGEMYTTGKPGTLAVKAHITNDEFDAALAELQRMKRLHMQVATTFY